MSRVLPYEIKYENSRGEVVRLDSLPFIATDSQLFSSAWQLSSSARPLGEGCRLLSARRPCKNRTITIAAACKTAAELSDELGRLSAVFDYDAENAAAGKLWINDTYLSCWCAARERTHSVDFPESAQLCVTVFPEFPSWCKEKLFRFMPEQQISADGLSYPYSYPKRYGSARKYISMTNEHFAPSPMKIYFYGECSHPRLYIGGVCIGLDINVAAGEYAVIDQRRREIYKVLADGTRENCFGQRLRNGHTFDHAPAGINTVEVESDGGVDIILIEQRSEPTWALS